MNEKLFCTETYKTAVEVLDLIFRKNEQLSYSELDEIIACVRAVVRDCPITIQKSGGLFRCNAQRPCGVIRCYL